MAIKKKQNYLEIYLNKFKQEVANEVGVNLKQGYNGDLTSKQAGTIGGNMVKKLIHQAESQMSGNNNQLQLVKIQDQNKIVNLE